MRYLSLPLIVLAALGALPAAAQSLRDRLSSPFLDQTLNMSFDKSNLIDAPNIGTRRWLVRHFEPPFPQVKLDGPTRLNEFVMNGKLELSLKNYLELVMANSTDILLQKLSVVAPLDQITRAMAPFDPTFTARFSSTHNTQLTTSSLGGGSSVIQLTQPFTATLQQTTTTGTNFQVQFQEQKVSTNSNNATFNPALTSTLQFNFTQPLIRNRGRAGQMISVLVAQVNRDIARKNAYDAILQLEQQAELAYWNVIQAREALRVQEQGLALQDTSLKRSQRELELGAISPLDIYQPQQTYANQEVQVTQAKYQLIQAEDSLRRQMGADLDPQYQTMPIVLTESVLPPDDNAPFDRDALLKLAMAKRQDLAALEAGPRVDELNAQQARNNLRPDLSLTGTFSGTGRGGIETARSALVGGTTTLIPVSIGGALADTVRLAYPTYGFGLNLSLPLRDRRSAADLADATVNKKIDMLQYRQAQQNLRMNVMNAITNVESSRASLKQAQTVVDFSQKRMDAEQKKYDLGVSTLFILLDAENQLVQAQANVVTQSVNYRKNLLNLLRVTGTLLDERGIVVKY